MVYSRKGLESESADDQAKAYGAVSNARISRTAYGSTHIIDDIGIGASAHDIECIFGQIGLIIAWIVGIVL